MFPLLQKLVVRLASRPLFRAAIDSTQRVQAPLVSLLKCRCRAVLLLHGSPSLDAWKLLVLRLRLLSAARVAEVQVRGSILRDFNGSSVCDANEPLVPGVTINVYTTSNALCGTAIWGGSTAPNYSVSGCGTEPVQVEFLLLNTTTVCVNKLLDVLARGNGTSLSDVRFVNGNSSSVNFGIYDSAQYFPNTAGVSVYTLRYIHGDPLPPGSPMEAGDWFVSLPYTNPGTTPPTQKVNDAVLGATWGVAHSKQADILFTSAFPKRHAGLGTLGSGGIYKLTPTPTSFTVVPFCDIGHRTRAANTALPYGSGSSFNINPTGTLATFWGPVDPLTGQPEGLGVVGLNNQRGLPTAIDTPSYDPAAFSQTSIEFSDKGDILLNFIDRHGNLFGYLNRLFPSNVNTALVNVVIGGDIFIAGVNCNGTYALENNAQITSIGGGLVVSTTGNNNLQGPGNGAFFYGDAVVHVESSMGAFAVSPGLGEFITTLLFMDPIAVWSGGTRRLSTTTDAGSSGYQLYNGASPSPGGKGNGLGDAGLSPFYPDVPIEIGGRVWNDANGNGIQDANEAAIPNVNVPLWKETSPGNFTAIAGVMTDSMGRCMFSSASGASTTGFTRGVTQLLPNTTYRLRFPTSVGGLNLTTPNNGGTDPNANARDSDANSAGIIQFNTDGPGMNNLLRCGVRLSPSRMSFYYCCQELNLY